MKMYFKGFITGLVIAIVGMSTVFAAVGIKSATFNSNKVIFNGEEISLAEQPMISVVPDGEANASNYMPVRAVLEGMGYDVDWDAVNKAVIVTTKAEAAVKNEVTPAQSIPAIPNPITEHKSLSELSKAVGFTVLEPLALNDLKKTYIDIAKDLAEIQYKVTEETQISFRMAKQTAEDISGIYETYPQEITLTGDIKATILGKDDLFSVAVWAKDGYSFSLYFETPVKQSYAETVIDSVK